MLFSNVIIKIQRDRGWVIRMQRKKARPYRSYLLRCWQEQAAGPGQPSVWRFGVQEVSGEQRQWAFGSFEEMVDFLLKELWGSELAQIGNE